MLRNFVLGLGIVCLLVGLGLSFTHAWPASLWLVINGLVMTLGVIFERWRYKGAKTAQVARGTPTGERFVDTESGALMEVYYDAATGERSYVRLPGKPSGT